MKMKSKYFNENKTKVPTQAISMGIQNFLKTKKIIVLAIGKEKAMPMRKLFKGKYNKDFPITFLSKYKGEVFVVSNERAAMFLVEKRKYKWIKKYQEGNYKGFKKGLYYEMHQGKKRNDINIIIMPGSGVIHKTYLPYKDTLEDYNLYFINYPGQGRSEKTGYYMSNYVNQIINFVEDMKNVIVMGHSFGAVMCFPLLAKRHPSIIGGIVANGGVYVNYDKEAVNLFMRGGDPRIIVRKSMDKHLPDDFAESFTNVETPAEIRNKNLLNVGAANYTKEAEKIDVPVLLFEGIYDPVVPRNSALLTHKVVKKSELFYFPEGTHYSTQVYKKITRQEVDKFINKHWPLKN